MLTDNEIVGYWYDENFGGQSGEDLVFFPGGEGASDFYNPGPAGRVPFRWSILEGGTRLQFEPALWCTGTVDVSCVEKNGQRYLRIEFEADEAARIPGGRVVVDRLFIDKPLSEYKPPPEPSSCDSFQDYLDAKVKKFS